MAFAYAGVGFIRCVGFCVGGDVGYCLTHQLCRNRNFPKNPSAQLCYFSVFFAMQGLIQGVKQGAMQILASVVLTLKSVMAQWRVIVGVRIFV